MQLVYLLTGGNLGDRKENLRKALYLIASRVGWIEQVSDLYETAAWGIEEQPRFLNQVVALKTKLSPMEVLEEVLEIEQEIGRKRLVKWGARVIDIDVLFYDKLIIDMPRLQVPHPYLHLRRFTLEPLFELSPDLEHPVLKQSISTLLANCTDDLSVSVLKENKEKEMTLALS